MNFKEDLIIFKKLGYKALKKITRRSTCNYKKKVFI